MDRVERKLAFLKKSTENRDASSWALEAGKFNVAASRYYYALRFAAMAIFEHRDLEIPKRYEEGTGPHERFINEIGAELYDVDIKIGRYFWKARELRTRGDYDELPVPEESIGRLMRTSSGLFQKIEVSINEN